MYEHVAFKLCVLDSLASSWVWGSTSSNGLHKSQGGINEIHEFNVWHFDREHIAKYIELVTC